MGGVAQAGLRPASHTADVDAGTGHVMAARDAVTFRHDPHGSGRRVTRVALPAQRRNTETPTGESLPWARQGSNLRPKDYESPALTTELRAPERQRSAPDEAHRAGCGRRAPPVAPVPYRDLTNTSSRHECRGDVMGYRGKLAEQEAARALRADGWALAAIATELGVAKSSVSRWVRDVPAPTVPRSPGGRAVRPARPHAQAERKAREIAELRAEGAARVGTLSARDLLLAGVALYAGEGHKRDGAVAMANSDPALVRFFCTWLRRCFDVDEGRLRARLYLHDGLDLEAATRFWSELTAIPATHFGRPYRAVPDGGIRHSKHEHGCLTVRYSCARTHRRIMGLIDGVFAPEATSDAGGGLWYRSGSDRSGVAQ